MNYSHLLGGLVTMLVLAGCDQLSEKRPQKHRLNYHGRVVTMRGKAIEVDNISISNKVRAVKMYDIPADISQDPVESVVAFDLDQVYALEPVPHTKCDTKVSFKHRTYHQVHVSLNDSKHTQAVYLIDGMQKLMCDEVTGAGPIAREFTFNGFKKLMIDGRSERPLCDV